MGTMYNTDGTAYIKPFKEPVSITVVVPARKQKDHSHKDFERQDWKRNKEVYNLKVKTKRG